MQVTDAACECVAFESKGRGVLSESVPGEVSVYAGVIDDHVVEFCNSNDLDGGRSERLICQRFVLAQLGHELAFAFGEFGGYYEQPFGGWVVESHCSEERFGDLTLACAFEVAAESVGEEFELVCAAVSVGMEYVNVDSAIATASIGANHFSAGLFPSSAEHDFNGAVELRLFERFPVDSACAINHGYLAPGSWRVSLVVEFGDGW
ncbi:hypothetical protein HQO35_06485 [Rhodococcus fascians]|nr:hypothetical protein [Rhodococcus fascians]MBY4139635.1 hypothetical protein [Rhodococcus fascians]MBY4216443.1 hypothetical protein [Rhodococcus fascians]MBY4245611.1 hypothetical protein [Rhodococcus fascians]MBY4257842.1 hypothetical protein [Rhodococcus fascians]